MLTMRGYAFLKKTYKHGTNYLGLTKSEELVDIIILTIIMIIKKDKYYVIFIFWKYNIVDK